MALADMVSALAQHWDDVSARLDDGERAELRRLIDVASAADDERRAEAALDIVELLLPVLPIGHPVERAIASGVRYQSGTAGQRGSALLAAMAELRRVQANAATPASAVWQAAQRRLLAAPCLSEAQVRAHGQNPALSGLIRLDADGGTRLPAFQFDEQGVPRSLVIRINHLLDSDADPWGVADWWLCPNAWLAATPADVLGIVEDSLLVATARAETEH
jgi:hypothetical protein